MRDDCIFNCLFSVALDFVLHFEAGIIISDDDDFLSDEIVYNIKVMTVHSNMEI